jgi:hypothetical protein
MRPDSTLAFEWDKWRPRGAVHLESCPCKIIDKFYHFCNNWEYCNVGTDALDETGAVKEEIQEKFDDLPDEIAERILVTRSVTSPSNFTLIAGNQDEDDGIEIETGNEIPNGTIQTIGPFFWDMVDTPEEAFITWTVMEKKLEKKPELRKFVDGEDSVPFSGYADCPYDVKPGDYEAAVKTQDPEKILAFLFKSISAQCDSSEGRKAVIDVANSELLNWNTTEGAFVMNMSHPYM